MKNKIIKEQRKTIQNKIKDASDVIIQLKKEVKEFKEELKYINLNFFSFAKLYKGNRKK
jgi:hypothetical protein